MNRRRAVGALIAAAAISPLRGWSQPREKVRRIGVLLGTSKTRQNIELLLVPFEQRLRSLGYVEGRNLTIEWREAHGKLEPLPQLAAELVALDVELIVAGTSQAAVAAAKATRSLPIVFVAVGDPVALGLVRSLAHPGGNITGFSTLTDATTRKAIEFFHEVLPRTRRLAVLHTPAETASETQIAAARAAGKALGIELDLHRLEAQEDLEAAFRLMERSRPDGLYVPLMVKAYIQRERIAQLAAAHRIPAVYGYVEFTEAGGLMSYGFSYADNWTRTAEYVARILHGARAGDLPVQQPAKFELVVNLKAARKIGLRFPQSVLVRADRVIE